jgi:phospholipid transport system transporter-binding protein
MNSAISISGALTFDRSASLLSLLDSALPTRTITLDFDSVTHVDSSAVALLLEWLRRAKAADCQLSCQNLPRSLQQLLTVYGLNHLVAQSN